MTPTNRKRTLIALVAAGAVAAVTAVTLSQTGSADQAAPGPSATPGVTATPSPATTPLSPAAATLQRVRMINFYPSGSAWDRLWSQYDHATVDRDLASLRELGANTVRVVVQPDAVGFPKLTPAGRRAFEDLLKTAGDHDLDVQVALFDRWGRYDEVTGSLAWVKDLLGSHRTDERLLLVELQNAFPADNPKAVAWGKAVLAALPTVVPDALRTVSVPGELGVPGLVAADKALGVGALDALDLHYFGEPEKALPVFRELVRAAGTRPAFVGESGYASPPVAGSTVAGEEEAQARFYRMAFGAAALAGLPPIAPWTLNDFTTTAIPFATKEAERHFGLRRLDGTLKPAAAVVRAGLAGGQLADWDGGFERASQATRSWGSWRVGDALEGPPEVVRGSAHSGRAAGCFRRTTGSDAEVPSLFQTFPVTTQQVTATAWARREAGRGIVSLAVAFFDRDGEFLTQSETALSGTGPQWKQLAVTATAPKGAVTYSVALKARDVSGLVCFDDVVLPAQR